MDFVKRPVGLPFSIRARLPTKTKTMAGEEERRRLQNLVVQLNEHKYLDQGINLACCSYEGALWDPCLSITVGPGQGQRVGGKIILSNFQMLGKIYFDWDDENHRLSWAKNASVRMIVLLWKDGTQPTLGSILKQPGTPDASIAPFVPYNEEMRGKRKVLFDRTYQLNNAMYPYTPVAGSASAVSFNVFLDMRKMPIAKRTVSYDATGAPFNGIKIMAIADCNNLTTGGNKGPTITARTRTRYTDA